MLYLVVETGKYKGKRIKLAGSEILIGRDETSGIRIGSEDVSRQHCLLTPTAQGVLVRDLTSRNGTFVNGEPIPHAEDVLLEPGGSLTVGPMTFQLGGLNAKRSAPPPAEKSDSLSDDDINTWLSEGDTSENLAASDTTIASRQNGGGPTPPPIQPPKKREFKSVAEEAEDIIRRHREIVAAREGRPQSGA